MRMIAAAAGPRPCGRHSPGARVFATFSTWRQRARARAELAGLDDRVLADIGISRAEAQYLGNKPFWKE